MRTERCYYTEVSEQQKQLFLTPPALPVFTRSNSALKPSTLDRDIAKPTESHWGNYPNPMPFKARPIDEVLGTVSFCRELMLGNRTPKMATHAVGQASDDCWSESGEEGEEDQMEEDAQMAGNVMHGVLSRRIYGPRHPQLLEHRIMASLLQGSSFKRVHHHIDSEKTSAASAARLVTLALIGNNFTRRSAMLSSEQPNTAAVLGLPKALKFRRLVKPLAKAIPLLQRSFAFISTTRFVAGYKPLRTDVAEERARSAALYESILRAETIAMTTVKRSCSTFEVEPLDSSRERLVETLSVPEVTKRQARRVLFAESDEPLTSDAGNAHLDGTCAKSVHSPVFLGPSTQAWLSSANHSSAFRMVHEPIAQLPKLLFHAQGQDHQDRTTMRLKVCRFCGCFPQIFCRAVVRSGIDFASSSPAPLKLAL
ncbi:MAG: hypothetical protein SGPRY_000268 [Prymnesium sp.]